MSQNRESFEGDARGGPHPTAAQVAAPDARASAGNRRGTMPAHRYRPFAPLAMPDRRWPSRTIEVAPRWCSVDLRDGNQALVEPMGAERKRRFFETLVSVGFSEIEVGFPSASRTDHDFLRELIDVGAVPDDVTLQVLTQARRDLIDGTFEALHGVRRAIVHLYNSTSELQRRVVFRSDRSGIVDLAVRGAVRVRECAERAAREGSEIVFEYSPESFTGTELDFAIEIVEAVMDVFEPTPAFPMIVNLPATVEMATPNVYADQIESFARSVKQRDALILSVHPHNDRGCGVAAAELALMAGADRVEGTLFGNGERTGNVDIVTLALNLMTQGVDPELDLRAMPALVRTVEHCNRLPVHPRHPYAGELVFTAFSGSHQDAIKKGLEAGAEREAAGEAEWEVPYLPIDPAHVGRDYEPVIRINSQSGKGGIAFVMEREFGMRLPRALQIEFANVVQAWTDENEREAETEEIARHFEREYLLANEPYCYVEHRCSSELGVDSTDGDLRRAAANGVVGTEGPNALVAVLTVAGRERTIHGSGNGPIDAFVDAMRRDCRLDFRIVDYCEHAVTSGAAAEAVAYVQIEDAEGTCRHGVGRDGDIVVASLRAIVSAVNRCEGLIRGEKTPK